MKRLKIGMSYAFGKMTRSHNSMAPSWTSHPLFESYSSSKRSTISHDLKLRRNALFFNWTINDQVESEIGRRQVNEFE